MEPSKLDELMTVARKHGALKVEIADEVAFILAPTAPKPVAVSTTPPVPPQPPTPALPERPSVEAIEKLEAELFAGGN